VTGFTGKLAAEYILGHYHDKVTWAVSARNEEKARQTLSDIAARLAGSSSAKDEAGSATTADLPKIFQADLACGNEDDVNKLRNVVKQGRLVLTTAGPFHAYGATLLKLCAELGVHYCDITGETNFVRDAIVSSDAIARSSGAVIVPHCGNDCIPNDLLTYEMHLYAKQRFGSDSCLRSVTVINEVGDSAELSGGTAATAIYNLSSNNPKATSPKPDFDPLLMTPEGRKSDCSTKNVTPSHTVTTDLGSASPWIMGPVMVNCVRRSKYVHNVPRYCTHALRRLLRMAIEFVPLTRCLSLVSDCQRAPSVLEESGVHGPAVGIEDLVVVVPFAGPEGSAGGGHGCPAAPGDAPGAGRGPVPGAAGAGLPDAARPRDSVVPV
jgi:short subunit dehydrogenase-like uncharacterized protein